mmetsp:Transcript_8326/g.15445  ORF Transcript_8326/g.15445 Transcript_8326/m.15445 type:complete len:217 (-) Transcript_8326:288-938(-)
MHPSLRMVQASEVGGGARAIEDESLPYTGTKYMETYEKEWKKIHRTHEELYCKNEDCRRRLGEMLSKTLDQKKDLDSFQGQLELLHPMQRQTLKICTEMSKINHKLQRLELVLLQLSREKSNSKIAVLEGEAKRQLDSHRETRGGERLKMFGETDDEVRSAEALKESVKGTEWEKAIDVIEKLRDNHKDGIDLDAMRKEFTDALASAQASWEQNAA